MYNRKLTKLIVPQFDNKPGWKEDNFLCSDLKLLLHTLTNIFFPFTQTTSLNYSSFIQHTGYIEKLLHCVTKISQVQTQSHSYGINILKPSTMIKDL